MLQDRRSRMRMGIGRLNEESAQVLNTFEASDVGMDKCAAIDSELELCRLRSTLQRFYLSRQCFEDSERETGFSE